MMSAMGLYRKILKECSLQSNVGGVNQGFGTTGQREMVNISEMFFLEMQIDAAI